MVVIILLVSLIGVVSGDYECLCNYHVESPIYRQSSEKSPVIGYVYEFDCKEYIKMATESDTWFTVAFNHQVGYIKKDSLVEVQICAGNPPTADKVLTTTPSPVTQTTTSKSTSILSSSTTEQQPSMSTSTQGPSTSTRQSTTSTTEMTTPSTTTQTTTPSTTTQATTPTKMTTPSTTTKRTTPLTTTKKTTSPTTTEMTTPSTTQYVATSPSTTIQTTAASTPTEPTTPITTTEKLTTATTPVQTTTRPQTTIPTTNAMSMCPRNILETAHAEQGIVLFDKVERKCYEIIELHASFGLAVNHCRRNGGRLATIKSSTQNEVLHRYISTLDQHKTWIGLSDFYSPGQFRWISGEPLTYTNWKDDNIAARGHENCILMDPRSGMWEDANCYWSFPYMCEFDITANSGSVLVG